MSALPDKMRLLDGGPLPLEERTPNDGYIQFQIEIHAGRHGLLVQPLVVPSFVFEDGTVERYVLTSDEARRMAAGLVRAADSVEATGQWN